jgi:hypothetical protein
VNNLEAVVAAGFATALCWIPSRRGQYNAHSLLIFPSAKLKNSTFQRLLISSVITDIDVVIVNIIDMFRSIAALSALASALSFSISSLASAQPSPA